MRVFSSAEGTLADRSSGLYVPVYRKTGPVSQSVFGVHGQKIGARGAERRQPRRISAAFFGDAMLIDSKRLAPEKDAHA
ncbi:hypothetical protein ASD01_02050 [Ensifer sp. Root423]|nr:hypothetical protein FA04_03555 [Ensifer adhaerens]KQX32748.1 hypothetical protein ASD01_02050 [Ensifer sp. Root423]KQZ58318.1 hypothetical protein ASD63_02060 [Ensifer sp. Root558]